MTNPQPAPRENVPSEADLSRALRGTQEAYDDVNRTLARGMDLNLTDLHALDALWTNGAHGPAELSERLGITSASGTSLVDRLEDRGYVRRRPHPDDRRRVVVEPTQDAHDLMWLHLQPLIDALDAAGAGHTPGERIVVLRYLRAVARTMREFAAGDPPG